MWIDAVIVFFAVTGMLFWALLVLAVAAGMRAAKGQEDLKPRATAYLGGSSGLDEMQALIDFRGEYERLRGTLAREEINELEGLWKRSR